VPNAIPVAEMSFEEAAELAYFGAVSIGKILVSGLVDCITASRKLKRCL